MEGRLFRRGLVAASAGVFAALSAGCAGMNGAPSAAPVCPAAPVQDGADTAAGNPYGTSPTPDHFQVDLQLPDPALLEKLQQDTAASKLPDGVKKIRLEEIAALKKLAELAQGLDRHTLNTEKGDSAQWTDFLNAVKALVKARTARLADQSGISEAVGETKIDARTLGTYRTELWNEIKAKDDRGLLSTWDRAVREMPPEEIPMEVIPEVARAAARTGDPNRAANYLEGYLASQRYPDMPTLTAELAAYYAAAGNYPKARGAYEQVVARLGELQGLGDSSKERIGIIDSREKDQVARARSKLIQAEAIFAYGTDYATANRLIAEAVAESRDTDVQARAQKLLDGFHQRRSQLLSDDLARLRNDFFQGKLDAETARRRTVELRTIYPEPDLQSPITAVVFEIEAAQGKASADRAGADRQKLAAADLALKEGRYPEAVMILKDLTSSPTEGQNAMARLSDAIDGVVKKQRDKAGDAVVKAMKIKDPASRRDALAGVQKQLKQLAADYPGTSVLPLIEKDVKLLDSQIEKLNSQVAPPPSPAVGLPPVPPANAQSLPAPGPATGPTTVQ